MSRLARPLACACAVVCVVFAASRLFHLTLLPVFLDESLHIYWPRRLFEPGRFLHHIADGKSLQIWLLHPVLRLASDPPWAARLVSVLMGTLGLACAFALGRRLYGSAVGLVAAALYTVSPFALFYDRMALADIFVCGFAALTLLASVELAQAPRASRGVLAGLALSACVLSKMTGAVFVVVPFLAVWWLRPRRPGAWKALGGAYLVAATLCAFPLLYFFSRFQVWAHLAPMVASWFGGDSVPPAVDTRAHASGNEDHLATILLNLRIGSGWLWSYWTGPLFCLGLAGMLFALYKRDRAGTLLAFAASVPFAAFALVSGHWFPRYIVCSVVPFAILAARVFVAAVEAAAGRRAAIVGAPLFLLLATQALVFDYHLLTDPPRAPLPAKDRFQYVEGWPSGYGTAEAARYLLAEAEQEPGEILVVTDVRAEPSVLMILRAYLSNAPRIERRAIDLAAAGALDALEAEAQRRRVYVALVEPLAADQQLPNRAEVVARAELRFSGFKPTGTRVLDLYRMRGSQR